MRSLETISAAVALTVLLVAHPARAQTKAACLTAAATGQSLRDQHKLVAARDQFRICAEAACPAVVQTDCTAWSADADRTIPTVVFSAKDATGNDTVDVAVAIDGAQTLPRLTGVSLPLDPGAHTFEFRFADGTTTTRTLLVPQGQRDIPVAVTYPRATTTPVAPPPVPLAPPAAETSNAGSRKTLRTVGWVAGGVGIAGLVVGAVATALVVSDKSAASCTDGQCQNFGKIQSAQSIAPLAGAGFIGGGALVGAGAILLLLTTEHHDDTRPAATLSLSPWLAPRDAGLRLTTRW